MASDYPYTATLCPDGIRVIYKKSESAATNAQSPDQVRALARDLLAAADAADGHTWDPRRAGYLRTTPEVGLSFGASLDSFDNTCRFGMRNAGRAAWALLDEYLAARAKGEWPTIGGQTIE